MEKIKHLAIIMDGNGRYALEKGQLRIFGHKKGVEKVREIAIYCANKLNIKVLTLYAFSTENWKRPKDEVNYLMSLPKIFFNAYLKEIKENNIKITLIGSLNNIPKEACQIFEKAIFETKDNTGMVLNFALNYGSQTEIVQACRQYAKDVLEGRQNDLNEQEFLSYLQTSQFDNPDLLIRTSGEQRISNFLLYQLAYSELMFIDTYWPNFTTSELELCIDNYYKRQRRFGGLNDTKSS